MIPLDDYEKWATRLDGQAGQTLSEQEYRRYCDTPEDERLRQLKALLGRPIAHFTAVNEVFFRARWAEVLDRLHSSGPLSLLEVASGDADMIPQMMARARPGSRYISANMNRILTGRLLEKTAGLPLALEVIEEDAAQIERHLPAGSVDIIAFQHAANDVIQAILCEQAGVDTIETDWMETLPEMIRIMQREVADGTLEAHAKPGFLALLDQLLGVLKPGGIIAVNHYMFQLDLDWGYPPELWENIIPVIRAWVQDLPGCQEVALDGFAPQWWLFLQKT